MLLLLLLGWIMVRGVLVVRWIEHGWRGGVRGGGERSCLELLGMLLLRGLLRGLLKLVLVLVHPLKLVEWTAHAPEKVLDGVAVFAAGADATIVLAVQVVVEQAVPVPLQRYLHPLVP